MRKGVLIGAMIGFLVGILVQVQGSFATGMASRSLSQESVHFIAVSFWVTIFVASLFGIIGAFLGALLQDVMERR